MAFARCHFALLDAFEMAVHLKLSLYVYLAVHCLFLFTRQTLKFENVFREYLIGFENNCQIHTFVQCWQVVQMFARLDQFRNNKYFARLIAKRHMFSSQQQLKI